MRTKNSWVEFYEREKKEREGEVTAAIISDIKEGKKKTKIYFTKFRSLLYDIISSSLPSRGTFRISLHYFSRFYGLRLRVIVHLDAILHACATN